MATHINYPYKLVGPSAKIASWFFVAIMVGLIVFLMWPRSRSKDPVEKEAINYIHVSKCFLSKGELARGYTFEVPSTETSTLSEIKSQCEEVEQEVRKLKAEWCSLNQPTTYQSFVECKDVEKI